MRRPSTSTSAGCGETIAQVSSGRPMPKDSASLAQRRCNISYIACIAHDAAVQPQLPQVLLGNEHQFTKELLRSLVGKVPPNVSIWRQRSAWNSHATMRKWLSLLSKALGPLMQNRYVVLLLDVHASHIDSSIFLHARRCGVRLVLHTCQDDGAATAVRYPRLRHVQNGLPQSMAGEEGKSGIWQCVNRPVAASRLCCNSKYDGTHDRAEGFFCQTVFWRTRRRCQRIFVHSWICLRHCPPCLRQQKPRRVYFPRGEGRCAFLCLVAAKVPSSAINKTRSFELICRRPADSRTAGPSGFVSIWQEAPTHPHLGLTHATGGRDTCGKHAHRTDDLL